MLSKSISVYTNDKRKPIFSLIISGKVDKFFMLSPSLLRLTGPVGEKIKSSLTIVPEEKYPFKIVKASVKIGKNIRFKLKKVKRSEKKVYLLTVENLRKETGRYYDTIFLKTDKKPLPDIRIHIHGNITNNMKKTNK